MLSYFDQLMVWIKQWGDDRNLTAPENLQGQTLKLVSEFAEISDASQKRDQGEVRDGFGDCMVVAVIIGAHIGLTFTEDMVLGDQAAARNVDLGGPLIALGKFADAVGKKQPEIQKEQLLQFIVDLADCCSWFSLNFTDCVEQAYEEIKDRKGIMFNGMFIKESDERYASAVAEVATQRGEIPF